MRLLIISLCFWGSFFMKVCSFTTFLGGKFQKGGKSFARVKSIFYFCITEIVFCEIEIFLSQIMTTIDALYSQWKSLLPMNQDNEQRLRRKFMLEFNYNSNHLEGNTLTYGQTEMLLLFGKVTDAANMKDLEDMKASNVALNMVVEEAKTKYPLTETFIRNLHKTLLREDYKEYRPLPDGDFFSFTVHAGVYKTRPNSVITQTGERFDYASPEETPALMTDLLDWYHDMEQKNEMSPIELASLFHYRYIRIHPFEDGNGRIARLLVNFILFRHDFPMIVVKSKDKDNYLNALAKCDGFVGTAPSEGAHASLGQIAPFVEYLTKCLERALETCIKAAKGQSIEEDDDFVKELKVLERQKRQEMAALSSMHKYSSDEVWNVIEYVFFPIVEGFEAAHKSANDVFHFQKTESLSGISKTTDAVQMLPLSNVERQSADSRLQDYVSHAKSLWYECHLSTPTRPTQTKLVINKTFYITFFEDHYFVDGIINKNFAYGTYPANEEKGGIISNFKQEILSALQSKM